MGMFVDRRQQKNVFGTQSLARHCLIGQSTLNGWTSQSRQVTTLLAAPQRRERIAKYPRVDNYVGSVELLP